MVEQSLPSAAVWAENQVAAVVDAYNLTQVRDAWSCAARAGS